MWTILYSVDVSDKIQIATDCFKHFTLMEIKGPFPKAFKYMLNFGHMSNAIDSKGIIHMLCCIAAQQLYRQYKLLE